MLMTKPMAAVTDTASPMTGCGWCRRCDADTAMPRYEDQQARLLTGPRSIRRGPNRRLCRRRSRTSATHAATAPKVSAAASLTICPASATSASDTTHQPTPASTPATVATSKLASPFKKTAERLEQKWNKAKTPLILFGAPTRGLYEIAKDKGANLNSLVDFVLNTVPNQGTETVRTEEALLATLAVLNIQFSH